MSSPLVKVNGSPYTVAVSAASLDVLAITLQDSAGVDSWTLSCVMTDDFFTTSLVNIVRNSAFNFSIGLPNVSSGGTFIFESKINEGRGANGLFSDSLLTRFEIFVPVNGNRVIASNETTEASQAFGWVAPINHLIRSGGGGGATGPAGATGARGATGAAGIGIQGSPGLSITGALGPQGQVGPTGSKGDKGDTGAQGSPGAAGGAGATGTVGFFLAPIRYHALAGRKTTNLQNDALGSVVIDPSSIALAPSGMTRTMAFRAVVDTAPSQVARVELFDYAGATGIVALSSTSSLPTCVGTFVSLANSEKLYLVRVSATGATEKAGISEAYVEVKYS